MYRVVQKEEASLGYFPDVAHLVFVGEAVWVLEFSVFVVQSLLY
jgi:hypothetical protein